MGALFEGPRFGDEDAERGFSREGREEDVGVEIWGIRLPLTDESRGLAIVDMLGYFSNAVFQLRDWDLNWPISTTHANVSGGLDVDMLICSVF